MQPIWENRLGSNGTTEYIFGYCAATGDTVQTTNQARPPRRAFVFRVLPSSFNYGAKDREIQLAIVLQLMQRALLLATAQRATRNDGDARDPEHPH